MKANDANISEESQRDLAAGRRHNMNIMLGTGRVAACAAVPFFLPNFILAFALFGTVAASFAQTPNLTPAQDAQSQVITTNPQEAEPEQMLNPEHLEALVAPIALYPDPLLIQVLAASTYPLELVQLKQWLDENKKRKHKALAEAVAQQNWDPSVQALADFPTVVNKLANKIQWTTDLGNAFLAQQSDVMDAVQRLRAKAQENGALESNDKQKVATETRRNGEQAITIEPVQQNVVYVPAYNTQTVYGDSGYSDSSGYSGYSDYPGNSGSGSGYDYSYVGYALAAAGGYAWGYYNWRDRYAEVNYDNYYNNNYSKNWNNKVNNWNSKANNWNNNGNNSNSNNNWSRGQANNYSRLPTEGSGRWQHDPAHRGNAPYGNSNVANRFGQGNNRLSGGAGNRTFQPTTARAGNQLAQGNRPSQAARASAGDQAARGNLARPNGSGARPSTRPSNINAPNRVGNRVPSNWPNGARGGAFGPSNGNLARAFSGRGAQSMAPSRMGPPQGLRAGGPPMGGGFHGGPPGGGFPGGGPPMGGLPAGGPPMGGAPPPPPPPAP
jgi:hypothetical protein